MSDEKFKTLLVDLDGDSTYPNYDEARQFLGNIEDVDLRWMVELSALDSAKAEIAELKRTEKVYHMNRDWISEAKEKIAQLEGEISGWKVKNDTLKWEKVEASLASITTENKILREALHEIANAECPRYIAHPQSVAVNREMLTKAWGKLSSGNPTYLNELCKELGL